MDNLKYNDIYANQLADIVEDSSNNSLLKIWHLNIRCLNSNYQELIATLAEIKFDVDVITLSETWNYNLETFGQILPGYKYFYQKSEINRCGG